MDSYFASLKRALPYIRVFKDKIMVFKISGTLCESPQVLENLSEQIDALTLLGIKAVLVHGGGKQIDSLAQKLGVGSEAVAGRRVTSKEMLEVVKLSLAGSVNTDLVSFLCKKGLKAVGLSALDGALLKAKKREIVYVEDANSGKQRAVDYGFVGEIVGSDMSVIRALLDLQCVPVICPLAADESGQVFNINADTVAARLASELQADKLCLLCSVDGVMHDPADASSLISMLDLEQLEQLIQEQIIKEGMLPKAAACRQAILAGVPRVHLINGALQDSILKELFTNEGCGTMIIGEANKNSL